MLSFSFGALGVLLFVAISPPMQVLARRVMPSVSPVLILAAAFFVSHVASTMLGLRLMQSFQYWTAASVFCFGAMVYVQVFGAVLKSISLHILLDLARRPGGAIQLDEIFGHQIPQIFSERCELLIEGGMVVREHDRFVPTAAGQKLAVKVALVRRLFGVSSSGLYNFSSANSAPVRMNHRTET